MRYISLLALLGLILSATWAFAAAPTGMAVVNVTDYGALPDGTSDCTQAFRDAIAAAKENNLPVYVPKGDWRLTDTLELSQQLMTGEPYGGWTSDAVPMARLLIDHSEGPGIQLDSGGSLNGLALIYDWSKFDHFAPAVLIHQGNGTSITNLRLQYPQDGIIMDDTGAGRNVFENIFIVDARGIGVWVRNTLDVAYLRNIEVWCNGGIRKGPAFKFGRNDELRANDLFAFQTEVGYLFDQGEAAAAKEAKAKGLEPPAPRRGTYGTFINCATDACPVGWRITDDVGLNIIGGDMWDHWCGFYVDDPGASVRLVGAELSTNGGPSLDLRRASRFSASSCFLVRAFANASVVSARIAAVGSFLMTGCTISGQGPALELQKGLQRAIIANNIFEPSEYDKLQLECGKDAGLKIVNNLGLEDK